jgi:hypothetical protein
MKESLEEHSENTKKIWSSPILYSYSVKDTKGGDPGGPMEDYGAETPGHS